MSASSSRKDCSWSHSTAEMETMVWGCSSEAGHLAIMLEASGSISSILGKRVESTL